MNRKTLFKTMAAALISTSAMPIAHALQPSDDRFNEQWAMNTATDSDINAPEGWDHFTSNNQEVVIALLDTGIDTTHIDLKSKLWKNLGEFTDPNGECIADNVDNDGNGYVDDCYGWNAKDEVGITDWVLDENNQLVAPMNDPVGHGTQMAGVALAASNNTGVVGVAGIAANVKIATCSAWTAQPVNELTTIPLSTYALSGLPEDQVECANYFSTLKDQGVNIVVLNVSGGVSALSRITAELSGNTRSDYLITQAAIDAIKALADKGILVSASMGNYDWDVDSQIDTVFSSEDKAYYPAAIQHDNIITVAGTNIDENFGGRTSWGRYTADIGAPGQSVLTTGSTFYIDYFGQQPDENGNLPVVDASTANPYVESSGSSPAAALVSGLIALLKADTDNGNLTADQIRRLLLTSAKPIDILKHTTSSGGLMQMDTALSCSNQQLIRRQAPQTDTLNMAQGETLVMEVQNYNCADSNGEASIAVTDLISNTVKFHLYDNGSGADAVAGDGTYSGSWDVESSNTTYKLSFGTDSVTNETDVVYVNSDITYVNANFWGLLFGSQGFWTLSNLNPFTELLPYRGSSYYFSNSSNASYRFSFTAPSAGIYSIYANWPLESTDVDNTTGTPVTLTAEAQYEITTSAGTVSVNKSQRIDGGTWVNLGTYDLNAGSNNVRVNMGASATGGLIADTIRVIKN